MVTVTCGLLEGTTRSVPASCTHAADTEVNMQVAAAAAAAAGLTLTFDRAQSAGLCIAYPNDLQLVLYILYTNYTII